MDAAKNSVSALNPPRQQQQQTHRSLTGPKIFIMPENVSTTDALKQMGVNPAEATATQLEIAKEMAAEQSPGFIRRYGPSLALAGIGAGAMGFFDAPEEAEPEFLTGADLLARDRDKYALPDEQITYVPDYNPFVPQEPVFRAAEGGVIGSLNQIGQISDQVAAEVRDFVGTAVRSVSAHCR